MVENLGFIGGEVVVIGVSQILSGVYYVSYVVALVFAP